MLPRAYLIAGSVVLLSVCANLLLKAGADPLKQKYFGIFTGLTLLGLLAFACGGVLYATLLRWIPLNLAQSIMATQYVGVILAAHLILHEPISFTRWLGILIIVVGVYIVGRTA